MSEPYVMTAESVEAFLACSREGGASANTLSRLSGAVRVLYEYLPDDKTLTRERLLSWRKFMEEKGYASQTIQNYVKYINLYLDYAGASDIRFNRGKAKDIGGMTFGYLTAIESTGKRERGDVVWVCKCRCGKTGTPFHGLAYQQHSRLCCAPLGQPQRLHRRLLRPWPPVGQHLSQGHPISSWIL